MAYGYRRKFVPRRASGTSRFVKKRNANQPVRRIQRKKYVPKVKKNTQSIYALAKQVRTLQRTRLGLYQDRVESCTIDGSQWHDTAPLLIMANNFIDQAPVCSVANPDTTTPSVTTLTRFNTHAMGGNVMPGSYNFWNEHHDDQASSEAYLPISTTLEFRLKYTQTMLAAYPYSTPIPEKVTIHVLKPKKHMMNSSEHRYVLPDALPGLAKIATRDMLYANKINTKYFDIVQSKTFSFLQPKYFALPPQSDPSATNQAIEMERYCKIHLPFPSRILKPDIDPATLAVGAQAYTTVPVNIPIDQQYWILISRSLDHSVVGGQHNCVMDVSIKRTNRWRDQHGSTGH